jgi:hypothetical protein
MPTKKKPTTDKGQFRGVSSEAVGAAQAKEAGPKFDWHYGRVTRMGNFEILGGREVVIVWATSPMSSGTSLNWPSAPAAESRCSATCREKNGCTITGSWKQCDNEGADND